MSIIPSPAVQWYTVEELVDEALAKADIIKLGRWASINRRFRSLVQGLLQRHIKSAAGKFIEGADLLEFFVLLDKTDSAIGGSVALSVITPQCDWEPRDINIMAPHEAQSRWLAFFSHHGYKGSEICLGAFGEYEHPQYPVLQASVVSHIYVFQHDKLKRDIVLVVSNGNSCMIPIIGAQTTSQMNTITSSHIYCLYPSLTSERVVLCGYYTDPADKYSPTSLLPDRKDQLTKQSIVYYESSSKLNRKCGLACGDIERTLFGWRGVGILQWGGYLDSKRSEVSLLPENMLHLAWQLGEWCDNLDCNMGRVILPRP